MPRLAGDKPHYTLAILDPKGKPTPHTFEFDSVTTVLDIIAKPALQTWYYNQGLEGVSKLLEKYGDKLPKDTPSIKSLMTTEKLGPIHERNRKGKAGTDLHEDLEKLCRGDTLKPTTSNQLLREWFSAALSTRPITDVIIASEQPLVSFRWRVAGTADLIFRGSDGSITLADLKTGDNVYWQAFAQGEAYKMMWTEMGLRPAIDRVVVVHCPSAGGRWRELVAPDITEQTFLTALEMYRAIPPGSWKPQEAGVVA